jgi:ribosomal protein L14
MNTVLVAVSSDSITVRTTSSEGTKEWSLAVTGDTVVRKNDQTVPVSALKVGDLVHVVLVRCPSGSVRALKIVVLQAAAQA